MIRATGALVCTLLSATVAAEAQPEGLPHGSGGEPARTLATGHVASGDTLERASAAREKETGPWREVASGALVRPIRTNTPGTGVFIGSGLVGQLLWDRRSGGGVELETVTSVLDFRYTPATHWVFGVRLPWILARELRDADRGEVSASGLAAPRIGAKHRFFRTVGRWSDRHAALEVELGLPLGRTRPEAAPALDPVLRDRLRPASGATDGSVELIYQEGRRRFVYGGDLSFSRSGRAAEGYRRGNEIRIDFDLEYIVLPLEYRRPGDEVFVLLEGSLARRAGDELEGDPVPGTGRTELLLAPGLQHVATEQTLLGVSFQFPVWQELEARELERDFNLLVEVRHAF